MIRIWSLVKRLLNLLHQLLFLVLLTLVLGKLLAFSFSLYAESHRDTIERWATSLVGTRIGIEHIQTDWAGFTPRLWLRNLTLGDKERLALGDVLVGMDLGALPRWKQNLPIKIRLTGTRVQILRDAQGRTRVIGLPETRHKLGLPSQIQLKNARIDFTDLKRQTEVSQEHLDLLLISRGKRTSLSVHSTTQNFRLRGEIQGQLNRPDWSGRFWSQGQDVNVQPLLQAYLPPQYRIQGANISFQAWSLWQQGQHRNSRLQFATGNTRLLLPGKPEITISRIAADLMYTPSASGFELHIADLNLNINAYAWPTTDLALSLQDETLQLGISRLDLAALQSLLPLLSNNEALLDILHKTQPRGLLEHVRATIEQPLASSSFWFKTRFRNLSAAAWQQFPGLLNLTGTLHFGPQRAKIILDSQDTEINLPRLFRNPLAFRRITGTLLWEQWENQAWSLKSSKIIADNADLQTISRVLLRKKPEQPLFMDLQTDFQQGEASHASRYYPVGIMPPNLVKWLDQAIVSGRVSSGSFVYYGPAGKGKSKHFPFHRTHDGHFEVDFDVEKVHLSYHPEWPPLHDVSAHVRFHNNALSIHSGKGRIFNSRIRRAKVRINPLKLARGVSIEGVVSGPLQDPFKFITNSPLRKKLHSVITELKPEGKGALKMDIRVPLRHSKRPPLFKGELTLNNAGLEIPRQSLRLKQISGLLRLDMQGVYAEGIQAQLLGGSIAASLQSTAESVRIQAQGQLPASGLIRQYPLLQKLQLSGASDFTINLDLPKTGYPQQSAKLDIHSRLQGLSLSLPPPLGKNHTTVIPFRYQQTLFSQTPHTQIEYGNDFSARLQRNPQGRISLDLKLSQMDLRRWLAWLGTQTAGTDELPPLKHFRIETGKLQAGPLQTANLILDMNKVNQQWSGHIESPQIRGQLAYSEAGSKELRIDLDKLHLQTIATETRMAPTPDSHVIPDSIPNLHIECSDFRYNKARLGQLTLVSRKQLGTHDIRQLSVRGKLLELKLEGSWSRTLKGSKTHLEGRITTPDTGKLLKKTKGLDFLSGSKAYASLSLDWPAAPFQGSLDKLRGEAELNMSQGRFRKIHPGLARILGLLNISTLGRRLKLDFKDLYKEGLAFDTIIGSFQFLDGLLITNNLEISGPSSSMFIAGSADLIQETYDAVLTVTPRLDTTLPIAGAIAGGPAAGVAVLLAQQLFSEELKDIQSFQYVIIGPWDNPQVIRKKNRSKSHKAKIH